MSLVRHLRRLWVRVLQRGTVFAGRTTRFDVLYRVTDPWQMTSEREQFRFRETNRIIEAELGPIASLLEVGCGEGHQSEYLQRVCRSLTAFDVSETAVKRARLRCPAGRFSVGDIQAYAAERGRFDLVVACEILYYVKDVPAALRRMSELGARCLVTYTEAGPCVLDAFFGGLSGIESRVIEAAGSSWKVVWWTSDAAGRQDS